MPDSCCAFGCTNRRERGSSISFFRIPTGKKSNQRRSSWIAAIKREQWGEKQINSARICSEHFISGKPSKDPDNPDYIPSIFKFNKNTVRSSKHKTDRYERLKNRQLLQDSNNSMDATGESGGLETSLESTVDDVNTNQATQTEPYETTQIKILKNVITSQSKALAKISEELRRTKRFLAYEKAESHVNSKMLFNYNNIRDNANQMKFFTGLQNMNEFEWILSLIENKKKFHSKLAVQDHLLLVLVKLKLGLFNKDIAHRFHISSTIVSLILRAWLPELSKALQFLIVWPEKEALRRSLPTCFRKFRNCISIIDCTEIFIQRPLNLEARAQTWSNYKNNNTIKYLISITPAGAVSFLSKGWGGRVSDKVLTINSGYLEKLEHGDVVLADRGFTIAEELATHGATLYIPAFTKGKLQMPSKDVDHSRQIANVRIHVERVIGRLRKFEILNTTIPISQVDLLDDIMVCIAALVNINPSVVSK